MYSIDYSARFKRDFKLCEKKHRDLSELSDCLNLLRKDGKLPLKYKLHQLKGNLKGYVECHLGYDLLLVWEQDEISKTITLARIGTRKEVLNM